MAAIAVASAVSKASAAKKAKAAANAIHPIDPVYQPSENAKANLGLAEQMYNGRMAGASDLERNIQTNQSNTIGNVNRNATNSSQALALAAASQGQTNDQLNNLAIAEKQNKVAMAGQLTAANNAMTQEGDKVYNDMLRTYNNDVAAKTALRQAAANNSAGMFQDLAAGAGAVAGSFNTPSTTTHATIPQTVGMTATPDAYGAFGAAPSRSNTFDGGVNNTALTGSFGAAPVQSNTYNNLNPYQYNWQQSMYAPKYNTATGQPLQFNYLTGKWQ